AELLDKAPDTLKDKPEYRQLHIELLIAQGKHKEEEAQREAQAGCRDFPKEPGFWLAQVELADEPKKRADLLNQSEKAAGDRAALRLAWLRHYQTAGKTDQEIQALLERLQKGQLPQQEQGAWLSGLARFQLSRGNLKDAEPVLEQLAALQPKDLPVRLTLVEV